LTGGDAFIPFGYAARRGAFAASDRRVLRIRPSWKPGGQRYWLKDIRSTPLRPIRALVAKIRPLKLSCSSPIDRTTIDEFCRCIGQTPLGIAHNHRL